MRVTGAPARMPLRLTPIPLATLAAWAAFALIVCAPAESRAERKDAFSSASSVGPNLLLQSLRLSRRFYMETQSNEAFLLPKSAREDYSPSLLEPTALGWDLGYAFGTPIGGALDEEGQPLASYYDPSHLFVAGFSWEFLPRCDFQVDALYNVVPDEQLRRGAIFSRTEFYFPLGGKKRLSEEVVERKRIAEGGDPNRVAPVVFPNLRVAVDIDFHNHLKNGPEGKEDSRSPRSDRQIGRIDQRLRTYALGGDLSYWPDPHHRFGFSLKRYRYDAEPGTINDFVNLMDVGPQNSRGAMSLGGISGFYGELASYPLWYATESVSFERGNGTAFEMILSQMSFSYSAPVAIGFSPVFYKSLSAKWNMGLGAEIIVGGGVYLLGTFQLSRYL